MALRRTMLLVLALLGPVASAPAATYVVAETGGDFTSIQGALDAASAGDTIVVREKATPYFEKIAFPTGGNPSQGAISLEAYEGEHPVIDGTGVAGDDIVRIDSRSYVRVVGFEVRNNLGVNDGSGIRITGSGSDIEIRNNRIHDIEGRNGMGITVYGASPDEPIERLVIDGNEIYDCEPYPSEALVLNGNVTNFEVTNNFVHDVNNIGIDFIGGETDINPDPSRVARNGLCRGNRVHRANQKGGGYAGGIYVDGGRDIVIEHNEVSECDLGIEVGAENSGRVASGVVVRSNVLHRNERAGLVFGGYAANVGRTEDCTFRNNTLVENDTLGKGFGEVWIQFASDNVVENNIVVSTAQNLLLYSEAGNSANQLDHNLWYTADGASAARFVWNDTEYAGFDAYRVGTGQDAHSDFADPQLVQPDGGDFHLETGSPALDAGDPAFVPDPGELDFDGELRLTGARVDVGADEVNQECGDGGVDPGEECDDGNDLEGDGCDSNCTVSRCGNGRVAGDEECDDGNTRDGDCCAGDCALEPNGSSCEDETLCTTGDVCSSGVCVGAEQPAPSCRVSTVARKSRIFLKDAEPDAGDRLAWRWSRGEETALSALGDPLASTSYALCIYDSSGGSPSLLLAARAPAGGVCAGKPCWSPLPAGGFRYADRTGTPDGLVRVILRTGAEGRARITLRGKGATLPHPELPPSQDPAVVVQLHNSNGACWEARYPAPALQSEPDRFRDRTD